MTHRESTVFFTPTEREISGLSPSVREKQALFAFDKVSDCRESSALLLGEMLRSDPARTPSNQEEVIVQQLDRYLALGRMMWDLSELAGSQMVDQLIAEINGSSART